MASSILQNASKKNDFNLSYKEPKKKKKNKGGLLGGVGYTAGKTVTGALGVVENTADVLIGGAAQLLGNEELAKKIHTEDYTDDWNYSLDNWYNPNGAMQVVGDVASGLGQSATYLGASLIPGVGTTLSTALMAGSGAGSGIQTAVEKTGNLGVKEYFYGGLSGATELVLEKGLGAASKLIGNTAAKTTAKVGAKSFTKSAAKRTAKEATRKGFIRTTLSGASGEAMEEAISATLDPFYQKYTGVDKNAKLNLNEVLYSAFIGALSGGALTAGTTGLQNAGNLNRGTRIVDNGNAEYMINTAKHFSKAIDLQGEQTKVNNKTVRERFSVPLQQLDNAVKAYEALDDKTGAKAKLYLGEIQQSTAFLEVMSKASPATAVYETMLEKNPEEATRFAQTVTAITGKTVTAEDIRNNTKMFGEIGAMDMLGVIKFVGEVVNDINTSVETIIREREMVNEAVARSNVGTQGAETVAQTETQAPETASAPTVAQTAEAQTMNAPIENAPKTLQIQTEAEQPSVNTKTEANTPYKNTQGTESMQTVEGVAQNEKASAKAEVKRDVQRTEEKSEPTPIGVPTQGTSEEGPTISSASDNRIADSSETVNPSEQKTSEKSTVKRSISTEETKTNFLRSKKSTAEYLTKNIVDFSYLPQKVRDSVVNRLHNVQNALHTDAHIRNESRSLSLDIMEAMSNSTKPSNDASLDQAREIVDYVKRAFHTLSFTDSDKSEIKTSKDKESAAFLGRWQHHSDKSEQSPDTFVTDFAREVSGFEHLEDMNYMDALFAIDEYYRASKQMLKESRVPIDDSQSNEESEYRRREIEDKIYRALEISVRERNTSEAKRAVETERKESEASLLNDAENTEDNTEAEAETEDDAKAEAEAERARLGEAFAKAEREAFDAIDDFFHLPANVRYNITRMYMEMAGVKDVTKETKKALASIMAANPDLHIYTSDKLSDHGAYWYKDGQRCIVINKNDGAVAKTILHEVTHALAKGSPTVFRRLAKFVLNNTSAEEQQKVYNVYLIRHLADLGLADESTTLEEANAIFDTLPEDIQENFVYLVGEEITARAVAEKLGQKNFLHEHGKEHRFAIMKAIAHLRKLGSSLVHRSEADKYVREIEKNFKAAVFKDNAQAERFMKKLREWEEEEEIRRALADITSEDVEELRTIGRKSINDFTEEDLQKTEKWARKFYAELGTKSPFFRAWFGDWREFDNKKTNVISVSDINVDVALQNMETGTFSNSDAGWNISVGTLGKNDTDSHAGREKVSVKMLSEIKSIIENSVLLDTEVSQKNSSKKHAQTSFMHKLYAPVVYDGKPYIAKVTVEEYGTSKQNGRRFYNLRGIKIDPAGGAPNAKASYGTMPDTGSTTISISDLFAFVKTYDKDFSPKSVSPMLLNEDGTPKVFYHGTNTEFTAFDLKKSGENFGVVSEGMFFFTNKKSAYPNSATDYARYTTQSKGGKEKIYDCYISIQKPLVIDSSRSYDPISHYDKNSEKIYQKYFDGEYDGIIITDLSQRKDAAILALVDDSTKIKSATDNIGTFSRKNPNIYRSINIEDRIISTHDERTKLEKVKEAYNTVKSRSFKENKDVAKDKAHDVSVQLQVLFTNDKAGIEDHLVRVGGLDRNKVEAATHMVTVASRKGQAAITGKQTNIKGEVIGDSLQDILKEAHVDENRKDANAYLVHLVNLDRAPRGKAVFEGLTVEESEHEIARLEKLHPEFKEMARRLQEFNKNLMQLEVDAGLLSPEQAEAFLKYNPHYITLHPLSEAEFNKRNKERQDRTFKVKDFSKQAKGGEQYYEDVIDSYMDRIVSVTKNAYINVMANAVARAEDGDNVILLHEDGDTDAEAEVLDVFDLDEYKHKSEIADNGIVFYVDGKKHAMKVSKNIMEGFKSLHKARSYYDDTVVGKANFSAMRIFKGLVTTWNPFFLLRNPARDIQDGLINTRFGAEKFIPAINRAREELFSNGALWQEYIANGGIDTSIFEYKMGNDVNKIGLKQAKGNALQKYATKFENMQLIIEQMPRFAEYILSREEGNDVQTALWHSADVTVNFSRGGTVTKALNKYVIPFLGPAVQGMSRNVRLIRDARKSKEAMARLAITAAILGILPMVLSNLFYEDDEEYENLSDNLKANYYLFAFGEGDDKKFIRLPKGRVVSALASFTNVVQTGADVEEAIKNTIEQTSAFGSIRPFFSPVLDVYNNKTWYGGEIEGRQFESVAPAQRYDESTSDIAKYIGKAINYSPKKIHYLLDQYSGALGDFLLPITSDAKKASTTETLFSSLITDPVYSNKLSSEFYDLYDDVNWADDSLDNLTIKKHLDRVKTKVGDLNDEIDDIYADDLLSDDEKASQVRALRILVNRTYKTALEDYKTLQSVSAEVATAYETTFTVESVTSDNYKDLGLEKDDIGDYAIVYQNGDQYYATQTRGSEEDAADYAESTMKLAAYADMCLVAYGAESAIEAYSKSFYEKAKIANSLGAEYENLYEIYSATRYMSGEKKKKAVNEYLKGLPLSASVKNFIRYICGDTTTKVKKSAAKAIKNANVDEETKIEWLEKLKTKSSTLGGGLKSSGLGDTR